MRDQIEPDNYVQIAEGIIQRLEEQCKGVKGTCQSKLNEVSRGLYGHCTAKGSVLSCYGPHYGPWPAATTILSEVVHGDCQKTGSVTCGSLSTVATNLSEIIRQIESLP